MLRPSTATSVHPLFAKAWLYFFCSFRVLVKYNRSRETKKKNTKNQKKKKPIKEKPTDKPKKNPGKTRIYIAVQKRRFNLAEKEGESGQRCTPKWNRLEASNAQTTPGMPLMRSKEGLPNR